MHKRTAKQKKMPMDLIGHMINCSVAFAIYMHVHYNYGANNIIL